MRAAKFDLIVYPVPGQKRMDVTAFTTQRKPKHYFYLKLVYNLSISLLWKVALLFRSLENVVMATVLRIINFFLNFYFMKSDTML